MSLEEMNDIASSEQTPTVSDDPFGDEFDRLTAADHEPEADPRTAAVDEILAANNLTRDDVENKGEEPVELPKPSLLERATRNDTLAPSDPAPAPSEIDDLKGALRSIRQRVAGLLDDFAPYEAQLDEAISEVKREFAQRHGEMISEIATAQILEKDADETLRKALVAWHKKTGEKTYDKDLGVSVSTKLEYDEGQAIDWSRANAPILIVKTESLNKKGFEAIAADLDFVTKKDVPTARIGKSL